MDTYARTYFDDLVLICICMYARSSQVALLYSHAVMCLFNVSPRNHVSGASAIIRAHIFTYAGVSTCMDMYPERTRMCEVLARAHALLHAHACSCVLTRVQTYNILPHTSTFICVHYSYMYGQKFR